MPTSDEDPVIDEIREVRKRISSQFDHDPQRIVEYYMQLQEQHRDRLVDLRSRAETIVPPIDLPASLDRPAAES